MDRSYISDSSDFEPFSSDSEDELDTSMIMKTTKKRVTTIKQLREIQR